MIKTFKKALAIMMTFIFVMSLVPAGVMAEETSSVILNFSNIAHSRGGDSAKTHQNLAASGVAVRVNAASGSSSRYGYVQFNFSGYEEVLQNKGTTLELHVSLGSRSDRVGRDFELYAFGDYVDGYDAATITYNSAAEMGLHTFNNGKLIFIKSDGSNYDEPTTISGPVNKENVISMLKTGMDNSKLTVVVKSRVGTDNWIYPIGKEKGIKICYSDAEIDNDDYVNKLANELTWDILSSEDQYKVTSTLNLPKKFYGADILWESTNEDAINPSSGEVVVNHQLTTRVKLTANITYTNFKGDKASALKEFSVILPKDTILLNGVNTGDEKIDTGGSSNKKYHKQEIESNGIGGKIAGNDSYIKVTDFSGNPYLNVSGGYVHEISFLLTDECDDAGIDWQCRLKDGSGSGTSTISKFRIKKGGLYFGNQKLVAIHPNQWMNFTAVAPKGGIEGTEITSGGEIIGYEEYDRSFELYANGELIYEETLPGATGGIYASRFFGETTSENVPSIYIDNVRTLAKGEDHNIAYDKEANISMEGLDDIGKTITLTTKTTVADIINTIGISDEYNLRMYDNNGTQITDDNQIVADGYKLVVAATNGTNMERAYSYYEIRVMEEGDLAFDVPFINLDGSAVKGNVKVFNYSGEDAVYKVFLAVYNDDEFIGIADFETLTAENGKATEFTTSGSYAFASGNTAKLFVWEADEITPKLTSIIYE